jgi:hypothetical protein
MAREGKSNLEAMQRILFGTMALSLPIEGNQINIPYGEGKIMIFDGGREELQIRQGQMPQEATQLKRAYEHQGKKPHNRGTLTLVTYGF